MIVLYFSMQEYRNVGSLQRAINFASSAWVLGMWQAVTTAKVIKFVGWRVVSDGIICIYIPMAPALKGLGLCQREKTFPKENIKVVSQGNLKAVCPPTRLMLSRPSLK
jgi:hypothetical protein